MNERTDTIAREAARIIDAGELQSIRHALRAAAEQLGLRDQPLPGVGRVRLHLQGMSMQQLGDVAYEQSVQEVMETAAEIMALLEESFDDLATILAGRAAKGLVDGGAILHIRAYTKQPIGALAEILVEYGCAEPEFETAETKHGRLDRIRFHEAGAEVVVTRCLPALRKSDQLDLFTGRRVATIDLETLVKHLRQ